MKTLYLECNMGAAGDMLMAALYEICDEKEGFLAAMNRAFAEYGVTVAALPAEKCGIRGTQMRVLVHGEEEHADDAAAHTHGEHDHNDSVAAHTHGEHDHGGAPHHHTDYPSVLARIKSLALPAAVKEHAAAIYRLIGEAEAKVHGTSLEQIHFHEVGTLDALADVCGCALLMDMLAPEQILSSPPHVGSGFVKCAHGVLPVPAPATAELLFGVPFCAGTVEGELLTPTGAAILRHYVEKFEPMPVLTVQSVGYGMGQKDFETANCVRAFYGETEDSAGRFAADAANPSATFRGDDTVLCISCNLDDMTGEAVGYAEEALFDAGALDVYTIPLQMKKSRPGILLTCLCNLCDRDKFTALLFRHTTTRGLRYMVCERAKLVSETEERETPCGTVRVKTSRGYGVTREKPEFDDLRAIAKKEGISLEEARRLVAQKPHPHPRA